MKRYAIVEIPDDMEFKDWFCPSIHSTRFLNGPVELMEAATKEAGVRFDRAKKGDAVLMMNARWTTALHDFMELRPVIPAPEPEEEKATFDGESFNEGYSKGWDDAKNGWPEESRIEPEKPCPNCQNVLSWMMVKKYPIGTLNFPIRQGTGWKCVLCNRPESEWTYASERWTAEWQVAEPGGIGCGGTGGPL